MTSEKKTKFTFLMVTSKQTWYNSPNDRTVNTVKSIKWALNVFKIIFIQYIKIKRIRIIIKTLLKKTYVWHSECLTRHQYGIKITYFCNCYRAPMSSKQKLCNKIITLKHFHFQIKIKSLTKLHQWRRVNVSYCISTDFYYFHADTTHWKNSWWFHVYNTACQTFVKMIKKIIFYQKQMIAVIES